MSDFRWGTWYPIATAMDEDGCPPDGDVLLWVDPGPWGPAVWHGDASDWKGFKKDYPEAKPTHWMPPPPSPKEMAAKPSLEMAIRSRLGAYSSNLDDLRKNTGPWSLSADRVYQQHIAILRDILKEAGLE